MTRSHGGRQATGEHITPVSPSTPNAVPGATRYGNMVLCCRACNQERGNQNLNQWMEKTKRVPEEMKDSSLQRIAAFRRFALYRDFTPTEAKKIKATIIDLNKHAKAEKKAAQENEPVQADLPMRHRVKIAIHDLAQELRG